MKTRVLVRLLTVILWLCLPLAAGGWLLSVSRGVTEGRNSAALPGSGHPPGQGQGQGQGGMCGLADFRARPRAVRRPLPTLRLAQGFG